jgi:predicted small integral membrane protein
MISLSRQLIIGSILGRTSALFFVLFGGIILAGVGIAVLLLLMQIGFFANRAQAAAVTDNSKQISLPENERQAPTE